MPKLKAKAVKCLCVSRLQAGLLTGTRLHLVWHLQDLDAQLVSKWRMNSTHRDIIQSVIIHIFNFLVYIVPGTHAANTTSVPV